MISFLLVADKKQVNDEVSCNWSLAVFLTSFFCYLKLQLSDEDHPAAEEAEVLRLRKQNAKSLSWEDFGLEDVSEDESNGEPTLEVRFYITFLCMI